MDHLDRAVQLAERVVLLRAQLAAAEGELRGAFGQAARPVPAKPGQTRPAAGASIAQRVRDLLHDGRQPLTFGELVSLVGGRTSALAARAALKKLRARKQVRFAGGKYSWAAK